MQCEGDINSMNKIHQIKTINYLNLCLTPKQSIEILIDVISLFKVVFCKIFIIKFNSENLTLYNTKKNSAIVNNVK